MTALNPAPSIPTPPPACACGAQPSDPGRAERIARMKRLAEFGMRVAERVVVQVETTEPTPEGADLTLRFARVARAVQQATEFEDRLANPRPARSESGERPASRPGEPAPEPDYVSTPEHQKFEEVVAAVHEMIARTDSPLAAERAQDDIVAEVDNGYDQTDLRHRATGELIAEVCEALDIAPDWSLFEDRPWIADARRAWNGPSAEAPEAQSSAQAP